MRNMASGKIGGTRFSADEVGIARKAHSSTIGQKFALLDIVSMMNV